METITATTQPVYIKQDRTPPGIPGEIRYPRNNAIAGLERKLTWWAIKIRILYFACQTLRSPILIFKTYKALLKLRT